MIRCFVEVKRMLCQHILVAELMSSAWGTRQANARDCLVGPVDRELGAMVPVVDKSGFYSRRVCGANWYAGHARRDDSCSKDGFGIACRPTTQDLCL